MTTIIIDNEPQYLEGGPPGVFVPLAEVDVLTAQLTRQLTALTVENATLQMEIEAANIAAGEWEETAAALTAERDGLREAVKDMLHIFDRGLAEGTIGRIVCERAWQALDELKPKTTTTGESK